MPTEVKLPQMGESIYEGTITKWLKKEGEIVKKDEPLYELSTDKVDSEIPSPVGGKLVKIVVGPGSKVPIHTVIAQIEEQGDGERAAVAPAPPPPAKAEAAPPPPPPAPVAREEERLFASPLVRKIAKEEGVDLAHVQGTGPGGRITKEDIERHLAQRKAPPPPAAPKFGAERVVVEPMTPMRARIAEHMVMSKRTSAHVTTVFEVDLSKVVAVREKEKNDFETVHGLKLTFTPFFAMAAIQAIKDFPIVNASVDGTNIVYKRDVNLGIAVALPDGLIVPVVKNADEKSFLGLSRAIHDLAERARAKKLSVDDVQGGTFTITNPGVFGGLFGTPIINQPQVAIMGVGTIEKRPVVIDDMIAIRPMCIVVLSFDHRVIDGAVADQFMARVKQGLQEWNLPIR
ncbi:MAG: dihydrolipoyllysine-residue succinyltransferase [Planctomycetes bacterium]|nr:dihydrolipoyllysine-residue succinyltransferase [Planctomycetota bacterium]